LLSSPTSESVHPSKYDVGKVSEGLLDGFFGPGFMLKVEAGTDGVAANNLRGYEQQGWKVNMHECVTSNSDDIHGMMRSVLNLLQAQKSGNVKMFGQDLEFALASALIELPQVLNRCNFHHEQAEMLLDSLRAMHEPQMQISPGGQASPSDHVVRDRRDLVTSAFADAVGHWERQQWKQCGTDLGNLMRKLVVTVFPRKYSLGESGSLKLKLELNSNPFLNEHVAPVFGLCFAGCMSLLVLTLALRARRHTVQDETKFVLINIEDADSLAC
jgi:hypothetical protein